MTRARKARQQPAQARQPAESSAWRRDYVQALPRLNPNPAWIPASVHVAGIRDMYVMTHADPSRVSDELAGITDPVHVLAVVAPHVLAKHAANAPRANHDGPGASIVDALAQEADDAGNYALARLLRGMPGA